jgi:hypothetical protein
MDRASNRDRVTRAFNDHLRRDRSKAAVTRISELGLIEMTRKRTRESLLHALTEPCEHCEGKGYTKSRRTVAYELLRELRRQGNLIEGDTVLVEVHPDVAQVLATTDHAYLEDMEKRLQKRIIVKARGSFALEDFELRSPSQKTPLDRSDADREGDRADRRRRRRKKLGPPAEVEAMLEEEERSSAANQEEEPVRDDPDSRNDERARDRRGHDIDAAASDSAPAADARAQAATSELAATAESQRGGATSSGSTPAPSGDQQVVVETTAASATTDLPKPQG